MKNSIKNNNVWAKYCDSHLLEHLMINNKQGKSKLPLFICLIWILSIIALAGPTWSKYASSTFQDNTARVIALDVSGDMNNNDIQPTRLQRAKYKILDMLKLIQSGQTGFVVYSSEAFVASPITNDTKNIENLVPIVDSQIVPVQGNNADNALIKSSQLLSQSGFGSGEIILVTSQGNTLSQSVVEEVRKSGYTISVLDMENSANDELKQVANKGNGAYSLFSNNDKDIQKIIAENDKKQSTATDEILGVSLWKDQGHWLIFTAIFLALFIARRGWLQKLC